MAEHALAVAFDTDDPEFARGVEIGRLWEQLRGDAGRVTETIHIANAEMVLRLADARGWAVVSEEHDETWMTVTFRNVPA
jgi:hypothetical protein